MTVFVLFAQTLLPTIKSALRMLLIQISPISGVYQLLWVGEVFFPNQIKDRKEIRVAVGGPLRVI